MDVDTLRLTLEILEHNWTRIENAAYTDEELAIAYSDALGCVRTVISEWGIQL